MHQRIARTLWYLASSKFDNQRVARTNAEESSATLRERRHDQEDANAYLQGRLLTYIAHETERGPRDEHRAERVL
jgi:hypothetical protein